MPATQKNRTIAVSSPLGPDVLLLQRMSGTEQLGRPFEYHVELLSENRAVDMDKLLGQAMTVTLTMEDGKQRCFHGITSSISQVEDYGKFAHYRATLRPWLWLLSRTANCRIFQEKTVPDILAAIFKEHGFSDFDSKKLTGTYRKWDYCVQYRETDFNFVSRLMEHEGIYYYFEQTKDQHKLVLADSYVSHSAIPGWEEVPYYPRQESARRERGHIYDWAVTRQVEPTKYALKDFDWQRPNTDLQVRSQVARQHEQAGNEVYDYPGDYVELGDGNAYAKRRIEELQAQFEQAQGDGNVGALFAGGLFKLTKYPRADQNRERLVVSVTHEMSTNAYEAGLAVEPRDVYSCHLVAIDSQTPYRPPRMTPKPVMQGPQTAIVVGKSGQEIWTDKYGRVKVQFPWDRLGKLDENSSCWVRVAQIWAGKQWGAMHIPRIGQEVIVDFLEGDPDRPIVTGRVYNADQMPPYDLPDNMTQSGLKSRSSAQGNAETFNELRFEDKKGEEEIYFHAEKNFNRVVENDDTLKVGFDKKDSGNQTIEIYNNQVISVGKQGAPDGSQTVNILKDRKVTIQQGNDALEVKQGNRTIKIDAGKETTQAATAIELKVGASSITIEPSKITIKSPQIAIQGDGQVDIKGTMTNVTGNAILALKGGLIKLN